METTSTLAGALMLAEVSVSSAAPEPTATGRNYNCIFNKQMKMHF
jgi:hypothetical protein